MMQTRGSNCGNYVTNWSDNNLFLIASASYIPGNQSSFNEENALVFCFLLKHLQRNLYNK